jgi:hypothetical protein
VGRQEKEDRDVLAWIIEERELINKGRNKRALIKK